MNLVSSTASESLWSLGMSWELCPCWECKINPWQSGKCPDNLFHVETWLHWLKSKTLVPWSKLEVDTSETWLRYRTPVCQHRRIPRSGKNSTQVRGVTSPIDFLNVHHKRCAPVADTVCPPSWAPLDSELLEGRGLQTQAAHNCGSHHPCYYGSITQNHAWLSVTAWRVWRWHLHVLCSQH